jgi:hypothetical protein
MTRPRVLSDDRADFQRLVNEQARTARSLSFGPGWESVPYSADWEPLGANFTEYGWQVASLPGAMVVMRGIVGRINTRFQFNENNNIMGMLPIGYRPARNQYRMTWMRDPDGSITPVRVFIALSGEVKVDSSLGAGTGAGTATGNPGTYVVVDGIQFPTF